METESSILLSPHTTPLQLVTDFDIKSPTVVQEDVISKGTLMHFLPPLGQPTTANYALLNKVAQERKLEEDAINLKRVESLHVRNLNSIFTKFHDRRTALRIFTLTSDFKIY